MEGKDRLGLAPICPTQDPHSLSLRQAWIRGCPMSSSWPLSQIRSSVKSLLMTAVVVVFNWERKCRATSGAEHPFLLRRLFLPWPITATHSGAGAALLENKGLRPDRRGPGSVESSLGPKPGFPIQGEADASTSHSKATGRGVKGQNLREDLGVHVR